MANALERSQFRVPSSAQLAMTSVAPGTAYVQRPLMIAQSSQPQKSGCVSFDISVHQQQYGIPEQ